MTQILIVDSWFYIGVGYYLYIPVYNSHKAYAMYADDRVFRTQVKDLNEANKNG